MRRRRWARVCVPPSLPWVAPRPAPLPDFGLAPVLHSLLQARFHSSAAETSGDLFFLNDDSNDSSNILRAFVSKNGFRMSHQTPP